MIKKLIVGFTLVFGLTTYAQQGTASPYSFYNGGDLHFQGTHDVKSMGSLAVYQDSIRVNLLNPASNANLQGANLSLGLSTSMTKFVSEENNVNVNRTTFDYLSLAFPAGKFGFSLGVAPHSFVGYDILNEAQENEFTVRKNYLGEGGINRAFVGIAYKITDRLNIGLETRYNFGQTENSIVKFIVDDGHGLSLDRGTREFIDNRYSGMSFNAGLNYVQPIKDKVKLNIGVTYSPEAKINNEQDITLSTIELTDDLAFAEIDAFEQPTLEKKFLLPSKYSIGAGIGDPNKWFTGIEFTGTQSSKINAYNSYTNASYKDGYKIAAGGFYTPDHMSITSYMKRVTYRFGARYENTGFVLNQQEIKDYAVSAGVSLPVGARAQTPGGIVSMSNLNIGIEYGQRGTNAHGLIKENYFNVSLGLSFNDFSWFVKRKFY